MPTACNVKQQVNPFGRFLAETMCTVMVSLCILSKTYFIQDGSP